MGKLLYNQINFSDDLVEFVEECIFAKQLNKSVILITGATGLIGSNLIHCLLALNCNIKIIAPVRNLDKAFSMFSCEELSNIILDEYNLSSISIDDNLNIDYIIHCAAPTSSSFFVEHPVETIESIYRGTYSILQLSRIKKIKSVVYLSSIEVYGDIIDNKSQIFENVQGYINPLKCRSSYPLAKRLSENLCYAYSEQYDVPVKIARLTQTTGYGITKEDNRIIAQFAKLVFEQKDIILHTTGESARPYCYTLDAVSAILYILLKGNNGEAYNIANEDTYISAIGLAHYLRDNFCTSIAIKVNAEDKHKYYPPPSKLYLSTEKLIKLGWKPKYGLKEIFDRLFTYLNSLSK